MNPKERFENLLGRNKDWLFAKILNHCKEIKTPFISYFINYRWQNTINILSNLFIDYYKISKNKGNEIIPCLETNIFNEFAADIVTESKKNHIPVHIFLSYIKVLKQVYTDLIKNSVDQQSDIEKYISYINSGFDCLDVAIINDTYKYPSKDRGAVPEIELLGEVVNNINIPLMVIEDLDKVLFFNKAFWVLFPDIERDKKISDIVKYDDIHSLQDTIKQFRYSSEIEKDIETHIHIEGTEYTHHMLLSKLTTKNYITIMLYDITQWKLLEKDLIEAKYKAEESDHQKTAFLANMSHEIRTPMNAIVGFAELISMSYPQKEEFEDYLSLIKKSSIDLLNIIEDIIDIAKIESKQLKIMPRETNLYELFKELEAVYKEIIKKLKGDNVKLELNVSKGQQNTITRTDPKRLKQVVSNLLNNAIKFTDKGKIEIGYDLVADKTINFFVKDSGIGIPEIMKNRIFERFVQIEENYSRNTSGTGLGLTICKNIINLLGGDIWVTSVPNEGSCFYFYLPLIVSDKHSETFEPIVNIKELNIDFKGFRILIAEDEEINYTYLKESLRKTGAETLWAKNGLEAINLAESEEKIDLILMDIKMPQVSGLEAAKYISHIRPGLPIIALTAFAMEADRKLCLDSGCIDYISKPVRIKELLSILNFYLHIKSKEVVS